MKIKTNKNVRYLKIDYPVDDENRFAFPPWILRSAKHSYTFLEKRGKIFPSPIQDDFNFQDFPYTGNVWLKPKKLNWIQRYCVWIKSLIINWPWR